MILATIELVNHSPTLPYWHYSNNLVVSLILTKVATVVAALARCTIL